MFSIQYFSIFQYFSFHIIHTGYVVVRCHPERSIHSPLPLTRSMTSLRMQGRIHDNQSNRVKANFINFTKFYFSFLEKSKNMVLMDDHLYNSQVNSVNPRHPHDSPLQLCAYCTLSAILHGKKIKFHFNFLCFRLNYI